MLSNVSDSYRGAANLLRNAARLVPGDRLLIVHESPEHDYYDAGMVAVLREVGEDMGAGVNLHEVAFEPTATVLPQDLRAAMAGADKVVFLARIGDQLRFADFGLSTHAVVSYALDRRMLGSPFGTADHRAFIALKAAVDSFLADASLIHVTCPAGTDFRGALRGSPGKSLDTGVSRFPMPVFTPLAAGGFSGVVALPGFLVGTGSMYYEPYAVEYSGKLFAHFAAGRLLHFSGSVGAVRLAQSHYDRIARQFEIDRDGVHSWHAGIHPGCAFADAASASYERWSGAAFGNPRLLHFHTCGDYAPGEISWNVIDPTITVDGITLWRNGRFDPTLLPAGADILARYPDVRAVFEAPSRSIGLGQVSAGQNQSS